MGSEPSKIPCHAEDPNPTPTFDLSTPNEYQQPATPLCMQTTNLSTPTNEYQQPAAPLCMQTTNLSTPTNEYQQPAAPLCMQTTNLSTPNEYQQPATPLCMQTTNLSTPTNEYQQPAAPLCMQTTNLSTPNEYQQPATPLCSPNCTNTSNPMQTINLSTPNESQQPPTPLCSHITIYSLNPPCDSNFKRTRSESGRDTAGILKEARLCLGDQEKSMRKRESKLAKAIENEKKKEEELQKKEEELKKKEEELKKKEKEMIEKEDEMKQREQNYQRNAAMTKLFDEETKKKDFFEAENARKCFVFHEDEHTCYAECQCRPEINIPHHPHLSTLRTTINCRSNLNVNVVSHMNTYHPKLLDLCLQFPKKNFHTLELMIDYSAVAIHEDDKIKVQRAEKSLLRWMIKCAIPQHDMEIEEFKTMLSDVSESPGKLRGIEAIKKEFLPKMIAESFERNKEITRDSLGIGISSDGWESPSSGYFTAVNIICTVKTKTGQIGRVVLNHLLHTPNRTSQGTSSVVEPLLKEMIPPHLRSSTHITTDNANAEKLFAKLLKMFWNGCAIHTLQLAIKDTFPPNCELLVISRKIGKHLKSSRIKDAFNAIQAKNLKTVLKPQKDVVTRWNSSYKSLSRMIHLRGCILELGKDNSFCGFNIEDILEIFANVVKILKPFYFATIKFESNSFSIADVLPCLIDCRKQLESSICNENFSIEVFELSLPNSELGIVSN
eukprot:TRINITY_DN129_c0_g1_i4.p1 TRINITY_DN129_c0_g1~~TRINITY_DN129_c0_g1_i4.p1  ORF type:complete len:721 (+),score=204.27 TRINITY_DN129_c0_g1_i4:44-2206(+)